jgi:quercetin dioxygenase-like cupin family protein
MTSNHEPSNSSPAAAFDYTLVPSLADLLPEIPEASIVSRTFFDGQGTKAVLFGFAPGQELSEHTAARPAILHFMAGEAELTLGEERSTARPGTWAYMPAHLPHSIKAHTQTIMLLLMLRS